MKILTATIIVEENEGENYNSSEYDNILFEAITNNTTASILDSNVNILEINQ